MRVGDIVICLTFPVLGGLILTVALHVFLVNVLLGAFDMRRMNANVAFTKEPPLFGGDLCFRYSVWINHPLWAPVDHYVWHEYVLPRYKWDLACMTLESFFFY